jgi:hypothetical protein
VILFGAVVLASCQGPPAPDVEVCRDAIHRLCIPDTCAEVTALFSATASCETTLRTKTGCDSDAFTFTAPTRDQFLNCRIALLRAGEAPEVHPNCDDVAETFDRCPDVVRFYEGK